MAKAAKVLKVTKAQSRTDAALSRAARSDISSILMKEKALREAEQEMKRYRASLGLFDTLTEAKERLEKQLPKSKMPLYIEPADKKFQVSEYLMLDADGIPIYNGDILFMADDSFFQVVFRPAEPEKGKIEKIAECFAFVLHAKPVGGNKDHVPECFLDTKESHEDYDENGISVYGIEYVADEDRTETAFRHRKWQDSEKAEWLSKGMEDWLQEREETLPPVGRNVVKLLTAGIFSAAFLALAVVSIIGCSVDVYREAMGVFEKADEPVFVARILSASLVLIPLAVLLLSVARNTADEMITASKIIKSERERCHARHELMRSILNDGQELDREFVKKCHNDFHADDEVWFAR